MFGKHFKLRTSNTDSHNGVIVFSLVEDTKTIGDGDLLLALMDDVTVITIRKSSVEVDIVSLPIAKKPSITCQLAIASPATLLAN